MPRRRARIITGVLEYLTIFLLLLGGVQTAIQEPNRDPSNVFDLVFSTTFSFYAAGAMFILLALAILYGRLAHKFVLRTTALLLVYMLMVFATVADMVIVGFASYSWIDSVIIGFMAAFVRVKLKAFGP